MRGVYECLTSKLALVGARDRCSGACGSWLPGTANVDCRFRISCPHIVSVPAYRLVAGEGRRAPARPVGAVAWPATRTGASCCRTRVGCCREGRLLAAAGTRVGCCRDGCWLLPGRGSRGRWSCLELCLLRRCSTCSACRRGSSSTSWRATTRSQSASATTPTRTSSPPSRPTPHSSSGAPSPPPPPVSARCTGPRPQARDPVTGTGPRPARCWAAARLRTKTLKGTEGGSRAHEARSA